MVLVGIPGSGKSCVARVLAARWSLPLADTDELVTERTGETPEEAFATPDGEARFLREQEQVCLAALTRPAVVALGSGAVQSPAVRDALAGHRVVWLQAGVPAVTRRLGMTRLGIPALTAIRTVLEEQLRSRAVWYEATSTEIIGTDRLSVDEVAAAIEAGAAQ